MLFLLMMVLVLMKVVAKPENWNWFFMLSTPQQKNSQQQSQEQKKSGDVDIVLRQIDRKPLLAPRPGRLPFKDLIDEESISVPNRLFEGVTDWTEKNRILNVTVHEAWSYYALLKKVKKYSLADLQTKIHPPVSYSVLNEFASDYRGEIFQLQGVVRKCREIPPEDERQFRYGLDQLYEVWMTTFDSGNHLYRVVFTELPEGLSTSEEALDSSNPVNVKVTGYFFKIQGYSTELEQMGSPLLLVRSLDLVTPTSPGNDDRGLVLYIVVFVTVIAMAVGLTVWRYRKSDREFAAGYRKKMREFSPENFERLQQIPTVNPEDVLKKLSESEADEEHK